MKMLALVREFHEHFGVPVGQFPVTLDKDASDFRIKFLREEVEEYVAAVEENDITKQFDSLLDLLYVTLGTLIWHGFPTEEGFQIVHNANMMKVRVDRAENSTRGSGFDVVKPVGWVAPDGALYSLIMHRMFHQELGRVQIEREAARQRLLAFAASGARLAGDDELEEAALANDIQLVLG